MAYNPNNANGQATMANSAPVVIASDQSAVPVTGTFYQATQPISGTVTANAGTGTMNVAPQAATTGGVSSVTGSLTNTAVAVSGSAGQVYGWFIYNPNNSVAYIQFYNVAAASVTVGTTTPVYSIGIPALSAANVFGIGISHSTAISIAATTTRAGSTAPGTSLDYNIFYK